MNDLDAALEKCFFERFKAPRKRRIGVELEYPVHSLDGGPVSARVVHGMTESFVARFGFEVRARDDDGFVYRASDPSTGDELSFECSYNTVEISFGCEADLFAVEKRHRRYVAWMQDSLRGAGHSLCGLGINPGWKVNSSRPVSSSRYRMLAAHLRSAPRYGTSERFHAFPHFGMFAAASQVQLDVNFEDLVETINTFTRLEPFKAVLLANSPFGVDDEWLCVRDHLWRNSLHGYNPHNCDMYQVPFRRPEEIRSYFKTTSIYSVERDGECVRFTPTVLTDYVRMGSVQGIVDTADGGERIVEITPSVDDVRFLRPFKFEDITQRGTVEFRSCCAQPVRDAMAVAAFHVGLACRLHALTDLLAADSSLRGHGYNSAELRRRFCRREWPDFADRRKVSAQLMRILDLAEAGLRERGRGEEVFLTPLRARAERLSSPARDYVVSRLAGVPIRDLVLNSVEL